MKKITIIFLFISLRSIVFSQDFFLRASISSDHSIFSSQFHSPLESIVGTDRMDVGDQIFSKKVSKGTYSKGLTYSFGFGKEINNYISFLVDVNYQKGSGVQDVYTNIPNFSSSQFSISETLRILPGIILSTGSHKRFSGYARAGLILPVWGQVNSQTIIKDQTGQIYASLTQEFVPNVTSEVQLESVTSGKLSVGVLSSVGLEYQIFDRISLLSEIKFSALNIGMDKSKVIAASGHITFPNVSNIPISLDAIPEFIKTIHYHEQLTAESNYPNAYQEFDPNKALDALNYGSNFNSIGFSIGLKFKL